MRHFIVASVALSGGIIAMASADRGSSAISKPGLGGAPVASGRGVIAADRPSLPVPAAPAQLGSGSDCTVDVWFNPTPRSFVAGCGQVPILPLSPADVNGDGMQETYSSDYVCLSGNCGPGEGTPQGVAWPDVVVRSGLAITPGGPKPVRTSLLSLPASFADSFISQLPNGGVVTPCSQTQEGVRYAINAIATGWADCDADGDLDLLAWVYTFEEFSRWEPPLNQCMPMGPTPHSQTLVWFENTGYQAPPPPVTGDLTGDGIVNGEDLALLLGNWGP